MRSARDELTQKRMSIFFEEEKLSHFTGDYDASETEEEDPEETQEESAAE